MRLHEEFKLYENMWEHEEETATIGALQESSLSIDEEKFYIEVQTTVDSCLQRLKLDKYCEDSYDNSYDDGDAMQYELLWNFSKVPNKTKLESALNAALLGICTKYGVDISVSVDDEVLADEGYVNLLVAYEIPYGTAGDLTEASDPYTTKDFVWLSDSYYADKFKRAVLAYLNGASLEDALAGIKGELMAAGSAPGSRKTGLTASVTTGEGEYCIAYRVAGWPASETAETFVNADSKEDAEELFFEYMLDPDNYDAGETVLDESDITIIDIYKKP